MRMIIIKQGTDLQTLGTRLLGNADGKEVTLQHLQQLNPHVDFQRIEPGTVLLVPDQPGLKKDESISVSGQAFDAFRDQVSASVEAATTRVRHGYEALASQRSDVNAVLKTAAVKRLLESDPELKAQLEEAAKTFKQDQAAAKASESTLKSLQDDAAAELAALAKLLD
ncbi:MAG: hypothetical protein HY067_15505 [Betaproteobacteria bacterium]|nr:hypothetical protein [Betaproteobacteria bacterium]